MPKLILASTSPYRRELLSRLGCPFETMKPPIDEEAEKDPRLSPVALAEKLAELKARSLESPDRIVLGGDQLVSLNGKILGKPGTQDRAIEALLEMSGQSHELITAICLVGPQGKIQKHTDITRIRFKNFNQSQAKKVVDWDHPLDCAGSYKIELHGISLVDEIQTQDFTAIQGLPLLALSRMLKECEIETP